MARARRNIAAANAGTASAATATNGNNSSSANKHSTHADTTTTTSKANNPSKLKSSIKHNNNNQSTHSSTSSSTNTTDSKSKSYNNKKTSFNLSSKSLLNKWKTLAGCICLAIACYFCYVGYLETRVNTPFDQQKMVQRTGVAADAERYWGTYRPLTYFGLKTRDPHSLVTGLMWYSPANLAHSGKGLRHWCEQSDQLDKYAWLQHDGRSFGVQQILDLPFEIKTSFVKYPADKQFGGDWTARIAVRNYSNAWDRSISLIWYVALDERTNGQIKYVSEEHSSEPGIYGETLGLGEFQLRVHALKGRILHKSYLSTVAPSLSKLKETVFSHFRIFTNKLGERYIGLPGAMLTQNGAAPAPPNFIAIQITAEIDFSMDISFQSITAPPKPKPTIAREFTNSLQEHLSAFDARFEQTFHLGAKGFAPQHIQFAKHALSNMLGGIGYFYGASRVQSVHTKNPVPYWKAPLYSAVPSRSFFPRGFLWDEGFHGLLISSWDLDIELDIICHWFDLLNVEGWIPREQILGTEALAKVPEEFVIQRNSNANPPTFFLTLKKILIHHKKELAVNGRFAILERLYPRLQAWFNWFNTTQRADILGAYQWRGRDANSERELNPKSLSSGLDDYPRASHPTSKERHVDLRCWIAFAARVMSELSTLLGKDDIKYYETAAYLADNQLLNEQHLSPFTETYADWGLHTDSVLLKRPQVTQKNMQKYQQQQLEMVRVTLKQPDYKFVDSTFGYVNLFPLLLELLDHDSPYLSKTMLEMRNPAVLWTKYGLRSLSKQSPLYMKRNTEHDPPYWRGPIWININYLALRALKHYGRIEGPYAAQAREMYNELRENIIENVFKEYERTGYIWEQYDDSTGHGKGCNPFTGWSSLVVLIMAEQY